MLGWDISVYRQVEDRLTPASVDAERGPWLAGWQAGVYGLAWIDELVTAGVGVSLGGDGYPYLYTLPIAAMSAPFTGQEPPEVKRRWTPDSDQSQSQGAAPTAPGNDSVNAETVAQCAPEEWVLIVAWDKS